MTDIDEAVVRNQIAAAFALVSIIGVAIGFIAGIAFRIEEIGIPPVHTLQQRLADRTLALIGIIVRHVLPRDQHRLDNPRAFVKAKLQDGV